MVNLFACIYNAENQDGVDPAVHSLSFACCKSEPAMEWAGEEHKFEGRTNIKDDSAVMPSDGIGISQSESTYSKEEKKKELKEIVSAFVIDVKKGISCRQCLAVDGVSMLNEKVVLSMDASLQTMKLGPTSAAPLHIVALSTAKVFDYNKLLSLRPDNAALKLVKDEDRAFSIVVSHGKELIIIIVDDLQSREKILKGLQVVAARAKQIEERVGPCTGA